MNLTALHKNPFKVPTPPGVFTFYTNHFFITHRSVHSLIYPLYEHIVDTYINEYAKTAL